MSSNTDMRKIITDLENGYEVDCNKDKLTETENIVEAASRFTSTDIEVVIDIYRKGMWQYGEPFVTKFPQLDDDILADAISEHITENGGYDLDLWHELRDMIQTKYTIFG